MFVKLKRDWFFEGVLIPAGIREIAGLEGYAAKMKKAPKEVLPSGAEIVEGGVTDLPKTHTAVTTLSEMAKISAKDAVTASHGPQVVISEEAMKGAPEKQAGEATTAPVKK